MRKGVFDVMIQAFVPLLATLSHIHAGSTVKLDKPLSSSFGVSSKATRQDVFSSWFSGCLRSVYSFMDVLIHSVTGDRSLVPLRERIKEQMHKVVEH